MEICSECTYLDFDHGEKDRKFWCDEKCERHYATDPTCRNFCKVHDRDAAL